MKHNFSSSPEADFREIVFESLERKMTGVSVLGKIKMKFIKVLASSAEEGFRVNVTKKRGHFVSASHWGRVQIVVRGSVLRHRAALLLKRYYCFPTFLFGMPMMPL